MRDLTKLGIVLNPVAGRGRALKIEKSLIEYLRQRNIIFQLEKTNGPRHATDLSRQMSKECDIIIAIGGDGTVNEVAAGLIGSTASLSVIPIGSGNDFNRLIGIPKTMKLAIDAILSGTKKLFDLGKVVIQNTTGMTHIKHFVNTLGIGIDAQIAKEAQSIKYLRGLPLYIVAAIKALSTYSPNEYTISENGITRNEKAYLICAGNGIYEGGGFKMLPDANPSDSILNMCLIRKMSVLKALPLVPKIIQGTHRDHSKVILWDSMGLRISSEQPFILHGDGEIFEENAVDVKIDLIPKAISVIVPGSPSIVL
jgi:YegS/Rv2252/BmrU family lipid kinase